MIEIRRADLRDLEVICHHRRAMFTDMGHRDESAMASMIAAFRPWLERKMTEGEYLAWLAQDSHNLVAGLGLWLMDWPPHLIGAGSRRGNIVNVYTEAAFRRQGIARRLMEAALAHCRETGIRAVVLHASREGRALYEKLGFQPTNEMRLLLGPPVP